MVVGIYEEMGDRSITAGILRKFPKEVVLGYQTCLRIVKTPIVANSYATGYEQAIINPLIGGFSHCINDAAGFQGANVG